MSETRAPSPSRDPAPTAGFVRALGPFDATMLVAGSMIGSGIFIVSAEIARSMGSPAGLLLVWGLTGLMTCLGALAYGELAAMLPRAGGQYVYLREIYGPAAGFLYGWTFLLVIQTGTIAAVAVAFGKFLGVFFPALGEGRALVTTGLPATWPFASINSAQFVAAALIALLTAVNLRGIAVGKRIQNIFTSAKVAALLGVIVVGAWAAVALPTAQGFGALFRTGPEGGGILGSGGVGTGLVVLGGAMVGALFSSDAWNNVTFVSAEVREPRKTLPRALVLGTALVTLLYLGANAAYLLTLDIRAMGSAPEDRVATLFLERAIGPGGASILALAVLVSTFGCNNGLILAGARVLYAMAKDGLFLAGAGRLNSRGVPGWALLVQGMVASILALSGTYAKLLDYVIFATLIIYTVTVIGLFVLRARKLETVPSRRSSGYPWLPAIYVLLAISVAASLLIHPEKRGAALVGLAIVASGIPVYYFLGRIRTRRPEDPRGFPTCLPSPGDLDE